MTNTKQKSPKKSEKYFTKIHEDAIIEYITTENQKRKNQIYVELIQPVFVEMIQKIVFRYKFASLPNIESLIQECEAHLIMVLCKFDPEKGSKAFSYFSVITKNWFNHKAKKYSQQIKKETQFEDISKLAENEFLSIDNTYVQGEIDKEFLHQLWLEIDKWERLELKQNEKKVLDAIKILLSQTDGIEIFNKKAVYLYCREITGLNTKQILSNLGRFRQFYKSFKRRWNG
jgi:DNA-directed RNA polymerase specialized sigma subunit